MSPAAYHPFFAGRRPTLHISHRGGAGVAPENTMEAFQRAVEQWRTDMLELDVHFSRDGIAWVSHDPTLDRCTRGHGPIAEKTAGELGRLLPRLTDVLEEFPGVLLNIDLKAGPPEAFAELVRGRANICCGSEHDDVAAKLLQLLPDACLFYPRGALTDFVMDGDDDRFHALDMPVTYEGVRLISPAFLDRARARGKWVNVWTVDEEAEMRKLIAEGVGGIMTDRPDVLRRVLG